MLGEGLLPSPSSPASHRQIIPQLPSSLTQFNPASSVLSQLPLYWYSWTKGSACRVSTLGVVISPVERGPTGCRFNTTLAARGAHSEQHRGGDRWVRQSPQGERRC